MSGGEDGGGLHGGEERGGKLYSGQALFLHTLEREQTIIICCPNPFLFLFSFSAYLHASRQHGAYYGHEGRDNEGGPAAKLFMLVCEGKRGRMNECVTPSD